MSMSTCTDSRSIACIPHRNFVPSGKVLISWYPPSRGKPHQSVLYINTPPLLAPSIFSIEILHISLYFLEIEVGVLLWISTFFFCCFSKISIFSFLTYSYQHNYEFCLCKFSLRISLPKTFCIFLARPHLLFFLCFFLPFPYRNRFFPSFLFLFFPRRRQKIFRALFLGYRTDQKVLPMATGSPSPLKKGNSGLPPKRGQIKAQIFESLKKAVLSVASKSGETLGIRRSSGGHGDASGSSASATPPPSGYNSDWNSDIS